MQGQPAVIELIRRAIASEITANLQYTNDWKELKNQGFEKLGMKFHEVGKEERHHMTDLLARLKFLGGDSELKADQSIVHNDDVQSILAHNMTLELGAIALYKEAVNASRQVDPVSEEMFKELLGDEEDHVKWIERQQKRIQKIGVDNYLQAYL